MDSVTDICKYHFLCFVTIIPTGQGHLRSPGEKCQTKFRDLQLRYMFLCQIFAKNAKNDPKTLFEASKYVKKQNSEIHGKVAKWRENACFDMFYAISQLFLKIPTWNFVHIFMRYCPLTFVTVFLKILIWGKLSRKEKNGHFFKIFDIFKILKIRDSSFVALLNLRHFI